ncbi:lysophospholipid acyltransferase family protein [Halocola ammonii]
MNKMAVKWISRWFQKTGWKFVGKLPKRLYKSIIVTGPHTSYTDYMLWIAVKKLARIDADIFVPHHEFKFPFTLLLKVAKAKKYQAGEEQKLGELLSKKFEESSRYTAIVFAEKSMERNDDLNDFFFDCAQKSKVPLVYVALDYERKNVKFHTHFFPTENKKEALGFLRRFLSTYRGKHPEKGVFRTPGGRI